MVLPVQYNTHRGCVDYPRTYLPAYCSVLSAAQHKRGTQALALTALLKHGGALRVGAGAAASAAARGYVIAD